MSNTMQFPTHHVVGSWQHQHVLISFATSPIEEWSNQDLIRYSVCYLRYRFVWYKLYKFVLYKLISGAVPGGLPFWGTPNFKKRKKNVACVHGCRGF